MAIFRNFLEIKSVFVKPNEYENSGTKASLLIEKKAIGDKSAGRVSSGLVTIEKKGTTSIVRIMTSIELEIQTYKEIYMSRLHKSQVRIQPRQISK